MQDAAKTLVRPKKPQPGQLGRRVQVFANHFPVKCSLSEIAHFDVDIKAKANPEREGARRRTAEKPLPSDLLRQETSFKWQLCSSQGTVYTSWGYIKIKVLSGLCMNVGMLSISCLI